MGASQATQNGMNCWGVVEDLTGGAGIEAAGMANQRMMELQERSAADMRAVTAQLQAAEAEKAAALADQRRLERELAASQERFQEEKAKLLRESEEATAKAKEVAAAAAAEKAAAAATATEGASTFCEESSSSSSSFSPSIQDAELHERESIAAEALMRAKAAESAELAVALAALEAKAAEFQSEKAAELQAKDRELDAAEERLRRAEAQHAATVAALEESHAAAVRALEEAAASASARAVDLEAQVDELEAEQKLQLEQAQQSKLQQAKLKAEMEQREADGRAQKQDEQRLELAAAEANAASVAEALAMHETASEAREQSLERARTRLETAMRERDAAGQRAFNAEQRLVAVQQERDARSASRSRQRERADAAAAALESETERADAAIVQKRNAEKMVDVAKLSAEQARAAEVERADRLEEQLAKAQADVTILAEQLGGSRNGSRSTSTEDVTRTAAGRGGGSGGVGGGTGGGTSSRGNSNGRSPKGSRARVLSPIAAASPASSVAPFGGGGAASSGGRRVVDMEVEPEEGSNIGTVFLYTGPVNAAGEAHGRGIARFENGDAFEGDFQNNRQHGVGTYKAADGFAEVARYTLDKPVGEGALWNEDRSTAWRMKDGNIAKKKKKASVFGGSGKDEEISLEEAARIAAVLGLIVPTRDVEDMSMQTDAGASFKYDGPVNERNKAHGRGTARYENGDVFNGDFYDGTRHGVGTYCYAKSGNAEVGEYDRGTTVRVGARWSSTRKAACLMKDGKRAEKISLEEAEAIATRLGLFVPPIITTS